MYDKVEMAELRSKSILLTGYLEWMVRKYFSQSSVTNGQSYIDIFTPSNPDERGCQLSLCFSIPINAIFKRLTQCGVVVSSCMVYYWVICCFFTIDLDLHVVPSSKLKSLLLVLIEMKDFWKSGMQFDLVSHIVRIINSISCCYDLALLLFNRRSPNLGILLLITATY